MRIILKMQKRSKGKIENIQRYFQSLLHKVTGIHGTNSPFRYDGKFYIPWSFSFPVTDKQEFKMIIVTPVHKIFSKLIQYFSLADEVNLGNHPLRIVGMEVFNYPVIETSKVVVKTLSPIVVYRNYDSDRLFLFPSNKEWCTLIKNSIINRLRAFNILQEEHDVSFHIKVINSYPKKIVYRHPRGNTIYYGSFGEFELSGSPQYLPYVIDMGIGMGTSKGFGTVELIKERNHNVM